MSYRNLREALGDLEKTDQLIRIKEEVDPYLEMAEIHRRVYESKGPALLFENVKRSPFQAASNLYGTFKRTDFLFRHQTKKVKKVIALKADPSLLLKQPQKFWSAPFTAIKGLPKKIHFSKTRWHQTTIDQLPQIVSWPKDGGAFITLPQVLTQAPNNQKILQSNLGMYRIQLSGNSYVLGKEIGLHYQLHRGIGVHHALYNQTTTPFKASIFVGGPPSHALAAIFPLPEDLSELTFAGMLGGRRYPYYYDQDWVISNQADFVITGIIPKDIKKPEGPFGDHLGYYSLTHDFPVMQVHKVFHRKNPVWHFTVVGRPPQEDSSFGYMIHQLVGDLLPQEFPGISELNAVDAAGVHPLLLAIGKERYMPFRETKPEEILTQANHILGSGQTSLAKYLIIAAGEKDTPSTKDIPAFLSYCLHRLDWSRDLHFQTKTTIDTLDYSGTGWNEGSKVVMACAGPPRRDLDIEIPANLRLPAEFLLPKMVLPGIMAIQGPPFQDQEEATREMNLLAEKLKDQDLSGFPLIVVTDQSSFLSETLNNFLWVTFTRSNPSHDLYGVNAFTEFKHWGCRGSLLIDARSKTHHAPVLEIDQAVARKVDQLFAKGGSLYGVKW